jgi:ribonuclease P protein subunit RPR2
MIRLARERIDDLFGLAEAQAGESSPELVNRYVELARRIGMRYNVRLRPEYRDLYCRQCSAYWVEGRTVRTRLRDGRRVETCLRCGSTRRVPYRARRSRATAPELGSRTPAGREEPVLADDFDALDVGADLGEEE